MPFYKRCMQRALEEAFPYDIIPPRFENCFAVIDGTRFEICRPSGDNNQQAAAFNSYYNCHNIGFQGITGPDGMILEFDGPHAGSDNDLNMLNHLAESNVLHSIREALINSNANDMDVLGDKIYNLRVRGLSSLRLRCNNEFEQYESIAGSSVRVSGEWCFGKLTNNFPFIDNEKKMKENEREIGVYMIIGALLTNIHTCFYGNETSNFFCIDENIITPPILEQYLQI